MGNSWNRLLDRFRSKIEYRILMLGLDAAGKTTILYKLKLGEIVTTIPTIGFNVETLNFKNVSLTAWDIGSRNHIRPLVRHYLHNTDAVVYVVDSQDRERLEQAADELKHYLQEEQLQNACVLILANKQDLHACASLVEISEQFQTHKIKQQCNIMPTSAVEGSGLFEAFDWLTETLKGSTKKMDEEKHSHSNQDKIKNDTNSNKFMYPSNVLKYILKRFTPGGIE